MRPNPIRRSVKRIQQLSPFECKNPQCQDAISSVAVHELSYPPTVVSTSGTWSWLVQSGAEPAATDALWNNYQTVKNHSWKYINPPISGPSRRGNEKRFNACNTLKGGTANWRRLGGKERVGGGVCDDVGGVGGGERETGDGRLEEDPQRAARWWKKAAWLACFFFFLPILEKSFDSTATRIWFCHSELLLFSTQLSLACFLWVTAGHIKVFIHY